MLTATEVEAFHEQGLHRVVRVMSEARAAHYRACFERFEAEFPGHRLKLDQKAFMIAPWCDAMIREPKLLDVVEDLIGRDILCWGQSLRLKNPDGKTFAGWHQDTAYARVKPIVVICALASRDADASTVASARSPARIEPRGYRIGRTSAPTAC